ncbi:DNA polymerase I [Anaerobranca gottschalkii]|uniref:DNA polymerase I n=1 Tax=Anaerobranca gottschalkii DSM 13577 TaxID=1120990 RepID=A0A1H9Z2X6_9FIRM|nr:DNA polymerase I [Anaerobranca gottschalkii]SES75893.1 DNA polymerase I [Anaerobranca gottschalkii DSM 13577]
MMKKAVIIDGNSLIYRAFFALPLLQTSKGEYTNGLYGFTTMLFKVIEEEKPDYIAVALDKGKKNFRHETFPEYKGHRPKMPVELIGQFKLLKEMLELMKINYFELDNYEADDIIGTFAQRAKEQGYYTLIVSGDRDVLQLVDQNVDVMLTKKGISQTIKYDEKSLEKEFGISSKMLIDVKALMGDTSDNIPGVKGVGEKTALKLIQTFGSLTEVYNNLDKAGGPKLRENLEKDKEMAFISQKLAKIKLDVPLDFEFNNLTLKDFDQGLLAFFRRVEFNSLIPKINILVDEQENDFEVKEGKLNIKELLGNEYGILWQGDILYIGSYDEFYKTTDFEKIKEILENEEVKKICFDYKNLLHKSKESGIEVKGVIFDTLLAAYLLEPDKSSYSIEDLAQNYLNFSLNSEDFERKASLLPIIYLEQRNRIEAMGGEFLLYQIEMPLSKVLCDMEREGIHVDKDYLEKLSKEFDEQLGILQEKIWSYSKEKFNINSPKQLGTVLFEELNLPPLKKTKTGYSTDVTVLEGLKEAHPIIDYLLQYRTLAKLKSTYADGLIALIKEDGKLHTTFNQTITATGRLSSTEPNLQNIPIRLEEGKKIRKAFIAPEGYTLLSFDYSQIELRILAHMSGDSNLIEGFLKGQDVHQRTASEVFGVPLAQVTEQQRRHAKAVNFGIVYGMSDFGLAQSLSIPRKEAKDYIERYFQRYQGVKRFIDSTISLCKEKGYVETLFNRRRYIHEINSSNFNRRSFAERAAINTPIQGTAADIIKKAMVDIYNSKPNAKMLLQVHDELVFLVENSKVNEVIPKIKEIMENTIKLAVPLTVDYKIGRNWMEME